MIIDEDSFKPIIERDGKSGHENNSEDEDMVAEFVQSSLDIALPRIQESDLGGQATLAPPGLSPNSSTSTPTTPDWTMLDSSNIIRFFQLPCKKS